MGVVCFSLGYLFSWLPYWVLCGWGGGVVGGGVFFGRGAFRRGWVMGYFLGDFPPLPFLALLVLLASFTSFPDLVWDLSMPLGAGLALLALFRAARYFLRSGVEWYSLL